MANVEIFNYLTNKKNDLATRVQEIETTSFKESSLSDKGLGLSSSEIAQKVELKAELRQVTEALARMAMGEYGICVHCQQSINILRLQVQPCVKTCTHCSLT